MNRKKAFYRVGRKLRALMFVEIALLTLSFLLCMFFFQENKKMEQNNSIFHLNQSLLLYSNSIMENLSTASIFPLFRISYAYEDPLLSYLTEQNHSDSSAYDFQREFSKRTSELGVQFQDIDSVLLFDPKGNLLESRNSSYVNLPYKNYSGQNWYQNTVDLNGKIYFLSNEDASELGMSRLTDILYASRMIQDPYTLAPICITLIGIQNSDISLFFKTQQNFSEQDYALFDASGRQILGTSALSLSFADLEQAQKKNFTLKRKANGQTWMYHISYNSEIIETYVAIRTPYSALQRQRYSLVFPICFAGIIIILLNIWIFSSIIRSINHPLARLVNMCHEIGRGNFSMRIPCSPKDELSYLTNSLNSMSAQVEQLIGEIYIKNLTQKDLELQMLRSQINPHFLYNTLEHMRMSAYTEGYQDLSQMCLLLSKVLRYGISNPSNLVTVREELEYLQVYTSLLSFCFPKLEVIVMVDEKIMDCSIIKVIFQPLVENSVNHVARDLSKSIIIRIWGYEEENDLVFIVSDDGNGMGREQLEQIRGYLDDETASDRGIGLKNIHRRINLYYGKNYGLFIDSSPGRGTSVTIRLPKTTDTILPGGTL